MYKVKKVKKDIGTRIVTLKNMETGNLDECYDDSVVQWKTNFDFIRKNKLYDCKIALLAYPIEQLEVLRYGVTSIFSVVGAEKIGTKEMAKLELNGNYYYIEQETIKDYVKENKVILWCKKKNLIQVNDVVQPAMLLK